MHMTMRMKSQYIVSAILLACGIPPLAPAATSVPTDKSTRRKPAAPAKPVVRRKSKDPTDIPTSSRRFRPGFTTENAYSEIACLYWNGELIVKFNPYQGEAEMTVRTPETESCLLYTSPSPRD